VLFAINVEASKITAKSKMTTATKLAVVMACLLCTAFATNEADQIQINLVSDSFSSAKALEGVFYRSAEAHTQSMESIMGSMSLTKAVETLEKNNLATPELMQVTNMAMGKAANNLRKQPKGYSGIDGARKLLNDMIYESMSKYDAEIAKCTDYYSRQCAAMEACRGQIAASNYIAANSRSLILDSQATINKCEVDIPTRKLQLKQHLLKCKHELSMLHTRLKIVMGDIAVMTMILEMTDCDKKLLQMEKVTLLHCTDQCTKKSFIEFNHNGLQDKINKLQSSLSHGLMENTFKDLFEGIESLQSSATEFLQTDAQSSPIINKTKFNNPPVPKTKEPGNPCKDPDAGAPSAANKRAAKCTIGKSPQCYKLQERFLLIQSGIEDERDELLEQIDMMKNFCEESKNTLEGQIADDEDMLSNAQTKLAIATEKEANAGETARKTAAENDQLNTDLKRQMKTCSANYINYETEMCALKKIRGELYKMKGGGHSAFFQDCEVTKWDPEECTKKCARGKEGGGEQKLTRNVMTHANGGAKCLPLVAMKSCGNDPCPVDCHLSTWSGWSKCSAQCGGGVSQRLREVKQAMMYGGNPCGSVSETVACNNQACEKDCDLSPWTKWSTCSKDCDGGTQKRQKFVKEVAQGAGKCDGAWSQGRLEYKQCNLKRCKLPVGNETLTCDKKLDIVLLIDGSGSLGKVGWAAEIKAAQMFVDAFSGTGARAQMSVILYSGPRTWGGVRKCFARNTNKVDRQKLCAVKMITHFTSDLTKVKKLITGLKWPRGSTLTSLALTTAKQELSMGRKTAQSVVVAITDGRPLSYRRTGIAARNVRKAARLVWVPVTRYAPRRRIKKWATRRWQENTVFVPTFKELEKGYVITRIVANICPKTTPSVRFSRR